MAELLKKIPRNRAEVEAIFGDIERYLMPGGYLSEAWEREKITNWRFPAPIPILWLPGKQFATSIRCHRLAVPHFEMAFTRIHRGGHWPLIKSYGGGFNFRRIDDSDDLSLHAYGIAVDLNERTNRQGTKGDMPDEIIRAFEDAGFYHGRRFKGRRTDPMHFQLSTGG